MAADVPNNVLQIGSKFCVPEERVGDVVKGKNVAPFDFIISAVGKGALVPITVCIVLIDATKHGYH